MLKLAKMKKYVLVDGFWWELENGYCYNRAGGRHKYMPSADDVIAEAENFEDLDWSCLLDPKSKLGWVSPDGRFYGCGYSDHADVASLYLKKSEKDLEDEGWVKIWWSNFNHVRRWSNTKLMLSEAQKITLEKLGLREYDDEGICEIVPIKKVPCRRGKFTL